MVKKRASSDGGQNAPKRLRTGENNGENGSDSDMSSGDRLSDSDGENNCSQNPGFRPQEPTVSCMLL